MNADDIRSAHIRGAAAVLAAVISDGVLSAGSAEFAAERFAAALRNVLPAAFRRDASRRNAADFMTAVAASLTPPKPR